MIIKSNVSLCQVIFVCFVLFLAKLPQINILLSSCRMQFADSNWPNRPERVVAGRAMQPFFRLFVSDKRNDYTNKRLHHRFGLFAPRAQLLF